MPSKPSIPSPSAPTFSSVPDTNVAFKFPYFQYTSLLGTHTLLLAFTAVFLPASTVLITPLPPQQSSLDKPQHRLLEPITASPVWTLLWLCAGTGVCQAWWAGWMRRWWDVYPHRGESSHGEKKAAAVAQAGEGKILALRNAWANTIVASALFHLIIILFGAPMTSHIAHTYLLSLLLSILIVLVPSYTLSLPILPSLVPQNSELDHRWIELFAQRRLETAVERALVYPFLGSFLGCWVGAFPIPLDWDRPWQAWPLTPAYGALAGYLLASWSSLLVNAALYFASQDYPQQPVPETGNAKSRKKKSKKKVD